MGLFDYDPFDFNQDGKVDIGESYLGYMMTCGDDEDKNDRYDDFDDDDEDDDDYDLDDDDDDFDEDDEDEYDEDYDEDGEDDEDEDFDFGLVEDDEDNYNDEDDEEFDESMNSEIRKSLVKVHFPDRNMTLSYYNDSFDLHNGDLVYVEGKLEGLQGQVVEVFYTFKIKLSDYKRVIAVIDTNVKGDLYFAGSHVITFNEDAMPYEKARSWFIPLQDDEGFEIGEDDETFPLDDLSEMNITKETAERGHKYYLENRVCYICLDGSYGRAIVEGSKHYEVEFTYDDGEISNLVCSCYCAGACKHEFAVMLQLKECFETIEREYDMEYPDYFAAITKGVFANIVLRTTDTGKITLR